MCHALPIQVSADSHINILWCPNTWKKTAEMFVGEGGAFSVSVKERAPYTSTLALPDIGSTVSPSPIFQ